MNGRSLPVGTATPPRLAPIQSSHPDPQSPIQIQTSHPDPELPSRAPLQSSRCVCVSAISRMASIKGKGKPSSVISAGRRRERATRPGRERRDTLLERVGSAGRAGCGSLVSSKHERGVVRYARSRFSLAPTRTPVRSRLPWSDHGAVISNYSSLYKNMCQSDPPVVYGVGSLQH